ncbi:MAG: hypothetical protein K2K48_04655 [Anaeroplasmataceae bacterium]|nr:hypothetical protein [Anaeroplasmataceae bacterium]
MKKIISFICIILCSLALFSCKDKGFEEVELSNKMKEQIALDYLAKEIEKYGPLDDYGAIELACPGKYKNVYFISLLSNIIFDITTEFRTENSYVRIDYGGVPMVGYINHRFYDLEDLYRIGKISEKALLELNDYTDEHTAYKDNKNWIYSYDEMKLVS